MQRSTYLQPAAIFWDRTARRAIDEADVPAWRGLPLAGGRLSFAALDILTRGAGRHRAGPLFWATPSAAIGAAMRWQPQTCWDT